MIETKRVVRILTDLEGINEDLLNLYEDIPRKAIHATPRRACKNLATLTEYNDKLEAFEKASANLRTLIERIPRLICAPTP